MRLTDISLERYCVPRNRTSEWKWCIWFFLSSTHISVILDNHTCHQVLGFLFNLQNIFVIFSNSAIFICNYKTCFSLLSCDNKRRHLADTYHKLRKIKSKIWLDNGVIFETGRKTASKKQVLSLHNIFVLYDIFWPSSNNVKTCDVKYQYNYLRQIKFTEKY